MVLVYLLKGLCHENLEGKIWNLHTVDLDRSWKVRVPPMLRTSPERKRLTRLSWVDFFYQKKEVEKLELWEYISALTQMCTRRYERFSCFSAFILLFEFGWNPSEGAPEREKFCVGLRKGFSRIRKQNEGAETWKTLESSRTHLCTALTSQVLSSDTKFSPSQSRETLHLSPINL